MKIKVLEWSGLDQERPVSAVPSAIIASIILALILQITWHYLQEKPLARASELLGPPSAEVLTIASFGDSVALSRLLMFRLQAFDNQPGISISFINLDYEKVIAWLERIADLDSKSQYPYLAAARIYAEVKDDKKKRLMLDFVHKGFLKNPEIQWPAMTHAVFIAKHRLNDLKLALLYAKDIRLNLKSTEVFSWVRQMELFVLEDMGDRESARVLLGGFLDSGIIKDEREFRFLQERLGVLEDK